MNLSRFRCGSHKLPISDRRYDVNQPLKPCTKCNLNAQCDEYHCTLICPAFADLRNMYIDRYYSSRPNSIKFNQLFNVHSSRKLVKLAKFVKLVMDQF